MNNSLTYTNLNLYDSTFPCDTCIKADVCEKRKELEKVKNEIMSKTKDKTWYHHSLKCDFYYNSLQGSITTYRANSATNGTTINSHEDWDSILTKG